jgi:hypothetical protein
MTPMSATFEMRHAVEIEARAPGVLFVTGASAVPFGERLCLEYALPGQGGSHIDVLAVRRHAAVVAGRLVARIELRAIGHDGRTPGDAPVPLLPPVAAVLVRRIAVRLLDVHETGCTFDSPAGVGEGVVGVVTVTGGGPRQVATVRCERSRRTSHRWPWRTDAWFLPGARLAVPPADGVCAEGAPDGAFVNAEALDGC